MNHRISPEKIARIRALHAAGLSANKIRQEVGVGIETVIRHRQQGAPFRRKVAALCDCGRPAARAGQSIRGDQKLASGCERCLRIEGARLKDETEGRALRPCADQPELSLAFLSRVNAACDAFFARRGLKTPLVSTSFIPAS